MKCHSDCIFSVQGVCLHESPSFVGADSTEADAQLLKCNAYEYGVDVDNPSS